jgi:multimeric flavodoxin WrbA
MKRILAIIGSPRKGDTVAAVQRLEQELKKLGEVEMEYLMLMDVGLRDCLGCHNCFMKGQETCREAAKVKELQERMLAADAVILASPTYNQGVTGIMKKFLDYFTFLWHRPGMFGVPFFGVATGGGMFGGVFKTMKSNVDSWGGTWAGTLGVPHYDALTKKYKTRLDQDFTGKAALLMKVMDEKELPKPTLGRLMSFRMWKMNAAQGFSPRDAAHWTEKGWLDPKCRYYYSAKINPLANAAAAAVMGIARRVMRSIYVGY